MTQAITPPRTLEPTPELPEPEAPATRRNPLRDERVALAVVVVALTVALSFIAPNFLTAGNLFDVLRQVSFAGIIACGMTLVIVAGEIDISVGSAVAFTSAITGLLIAKVDLPYPIAILLVLLVGAGIGAAAGAVRAFLAVPSFIVTLALFSALSGAALMLTNAIPIPLLDPAFAWLGRGNILGLPVPAAIMLAVFAVFWFLADRTTFGRSVYAIGGNAEAARLAGIPVAAIRVTVFAATGLLAALSGVLQTAQLGAGNATIGRGLEFAVITAVIVGGASLAGGKGSMVGTLLGVLFIGILNNGMVLLGVNSYAQYIANGALVLAAVTLSTLANRARTRRRVRTS